jgi:hypothetical protein
MDKSRFVSGVAAGLGVVVVCFCLLLVAGGVRGGQQTGDNRPRSSSQKLQRADLLGVLDCATRPDQLLAVRPESYAGAGYRARYLYPVPPGTEANMLNMIGDTDRLVLVLYHTDGQSAALFEVGINGPQSQRTFSLRDGANLERQGSRWVVKDILNGGVSTWREITRHSERASATPLAVVPRAAVVRANASCEFPPAGLEFMAVTTSGDQFNWKFKDGASAGIPFKKRLGPFNNSDLSTVPSGQVYWNSYGPD